MKRYYWKTNNGLFLTKNGNFTRDITKAGVFADKDLEKMTSRGLLKNINGSKYDIDTYEETIHDCCDELLEEMKRYPEVFGEDLKNAGLI